ncbi:hypothetical protein [Paraburkholderia bannensis]|uniref:hypothetical protein n=1 Tax=Paraburkholderia bannensis TaxID=765414 RepID=UPI0005A63BA6|nr:hypothetical protein [Paraburkholderia bannensis]
MDDTKQNESTSTVDKTNTKALEKPAGSKKTTQGNTITVYCKLPHGIRYNLPDGSTLRLIGSLGEERSPLQVSGMPGRDSVAGFGVTKNVDPAAWAWVVDNHGDSVAHKNKLIFAQEVNDADSGAAEASEKSGEATGFEPIDPSKDPTNDKDANARNLGTASATK